MRGLTCGSTAPTGAKVHTLTKEEVLAELAELENLLWALSRFNSFLNGIKYGDVDVRTAINTCIRERKLCTLQAREVALSDTVQETIEQVKRDNRKLLK